MSKNLSQRWWYLHANNFLWREGEVRDDPDEKVVFLKFSVIVVLGKYLLKLNIILILMLFKRFVRGLWVKVAGIIPSNHFTKSAIMYS